LRSAETMTERERFLATMNYEPRDRAPICDFGFWTETIELWKQQGLPEHLDEWSATDFFGMDRYDRVYVGVNHGLYPGFEQKVLEDLGDEVIELTWDGTIQRRHKWMSSIPMHLGHTLVDRDSWREHYLPRLQPDQPGRVPEDWEAKVREWSKPDRPYCQVIGGGSLFGWIRNWMGIENVAYCVYDDPAWFEEMVETVFQLIYWHLEKTLSAGVPADACAMWEDMCYSGGPLLGVQHFKQYLVPRYRKITDLLHRYGVKIVWLDCDGKIDALLPLWLDCGVNCMFPIEVGTWRADPVQWRKEYGRDLLMMGGFDKQILAKGPEAIDAEIDRLTPLVEEGGYIPFCDHRVPPTVSLANYVHYLKRARKVWGKDTNLPPFPEIALN